MACSYVPSYDYIHLISAPEFDILYKVIVLGRIEKLVRLTRAMLPAVLLHQMFELASAIARMSWALGVHSHLAVLAPYKITAR